MVVMVWYSVSVLFSAVYVNDETATSLTVMLTVVDVEPAELFAQTVNTAPATTTVGVPEITPVLVSKLNPPGGVAVDGPRRHAARRAAVGEGRGYRDDGASLRSRDVGVRDVTGNARLTNSVNVAVVVAPRAVTVTVWVVLVCVSVGVPEMVPVRQFMVKPSGSIGETS